MNQETRSAFSRPSFTPKREKSTENRLFVERSGENRGVSKELSTHKFSSFRGDVNQSLQLKVTNKASPSVHIELKRRESDYPEAKENPEATATVRVGNSRNEKKLVSKILVSEIHFCRFLFKLLMRIGESSRKGLLEASSSEVDNITRSYVGIIRHKVDRLVSFTTNNYINCTCYEEYKNTSDYHKLIKIAKEYRERYSSELRQHWTEAECRFTTDPTTAMISHLHSLLKNRHSKETAVQGQQNEIITLDYLITAKQLIDIFRHGENHEKFARKSRIEEIVEGKTADITPELFGKIMDRAVELVGVSWRGPETSYEHKAAILA